MQITPLAKSFGKTVPIQVHGCKSPVHVVFYRSPAGVILYPENAKGELVGMAATIYKEEYCDRARATPESEARWALERCGFTPA